MLLLQGGGAPRLRQPTYLASPSRRGPANYGVGMSDGTNGPQQNMYGQNNGMSPMSLPVPQTPAQSGYASPDTFARGYVGSLNI